MPNRLSYQQRPSNYHQSSKNYTNTKNERTSGGAFDFITNRVKNSSPRNSFDMSSWIQNGSVCKASCYSQLRDENELRKQERTTSFSSNNSCYSTEDNSSLNDSFEDANDIKDYVGFENSSWLQGHQGQGTFKQDLLEFDGGTPPLLPLVHFFFIRRKNQFGWELKFFVYSRTCNDPIIFHTRMYVLDVLGDRGDLGNPTSQCANKNNTMKSKNQSCFTG